MNRSRTTFLAIALLAFAINWARAQGNLDEVYRIKAEAMAMYPADPVAAAKAANEALERRALQLYSRNPKEIAAIAFLGYYTKNVYEVPLVCRENAIDIASFASAFEKANRVPFEAAAKVVDSNALIERARPLANKGARAELARFAAAQRTDVKASCLFIKENAEAMANGAKFSNVMPAVHERLVGQ